MKIIDTTGRLTSEGMNALLTNATLIDCQCPTHLVELLAGVRKFEAYTQSCIERFPDDADTHVWLSECARNLDHLLSATLVQLARLEGFIDDENEFKKP